MKIETENENENETQIRAETETEVETQTEVATETEMALLVDTCQLAHEDGRIEPDPTPVTVAGHIRMNSEGYGELELSPVHFQISLVGYPLGSSDPADRGVIPIATPLSEKVKVRQSYH